jgi:oligopeptide transport system substrate-binding protein
MMAPLWVFRSRRLAAAGILLAATLGCTYLFPTPTPFPSPTATATPSPTAFSAKAFLQAVEADAENFPVRYISPGGEMSVVVPHGWVFNQQEDSGKELDSISETAGGEPVAAVYVIERIGKETAPRQALDAFWKSEWISARAVEITDQAEFPASSGAAGWKAGGTMAAGPDPDGRESCVWVAYPKDQTAFVIAGYPDRSASPESFLAEWEAMALSFHWEDTRTRDVDKTNALQLLEPEPDSLDPAVAPGGAGGIIGDLYSGLVMLDSTLNVRPGIAERWDVTPDGKTFTFHLRDNARFHNGRPVTADDVLFSWLRAASPELNSDTAARYLGDVLGLMEYRNGDADHISGLRVVDPLTFQVTLDAPKPFFLQKITFPTSWIVDRYTVRLPHWELHPNGTGPFRLVQRIAGKSLILEADPGYYDTAPQLQYIVYWMTSASQESLYKSGKIDRMDVSQNMLAAVSDPHDPLFGTARLDPKLCTDFIFFNTGSPPFDDSLVRKAFALAVDREVFVEVSPEEGDIAGAGILPPGMPGYAADPAQNAYDPQTAERLISQSRYFNGSADPPEIGFTVASEAADYDSTLEFLVDSWENTLGLEILVQGMPPAEYKQQMGSKPSGQMVFFQHCADYPDPENFYHFLFSGDYAGIYYGYKSGPLDLLLESASAESDWTKRIDLYRQADRILYDDAPAMVLSYPGPTYIVWKPHVLGYVPSAVDVPQHQHLWIQRD